MENKIPRNVKPTSLQGTPVGERGMFLKRTLLELEASLEEVRQQRIAVKRQKNKKFEKNRNSSSKVETKSIYRH